MSVGWLALNTTSAWPIGAQRLQLEADGLVLEVPQRLGPGLDFLLHRVLEPEHAGRGCVVERAGVAADEERDLIPQERWRSAGRRAAGRPCSADRDSRCSRPAPRSSNPAVRRPATRWWRTRRGADRGSAGSGLRRRRRELARAPKSTVPYHLPANSLRPISTGSVGGAIDGGSCAWRRRPSTRSIAAAEDECAAHDRLAHCRRKVEPAGWFDPWIAEWQVTQLRLNRRLLLCATLLS